MTLRDFMRACKRGMGPAQSKAYLSLDKLFHFDPLLCEPTPEVQPLLPNAMLSLNIWWATREVETSAARFYHVTRDEVSHTVTWLLPASKRDPVAAGESRTHGCCCQQERHPVCPLHLFRDYISVIIMKFGHKIQDPSESFPLFPSAAGKTLLKRYVVAAYRLVLQRAGIATLTSDASGRPRQRFAGHVCRVVGAVWLFSTLRELYLVQLFARWGSQAIARYIQLSPLQEQHNFAARAMHAFSIHQVRQQVRQRLAIESSERSTSCQDIIKDIFTAMRQHQQQLSKTIEQRIQVLESTVGAAGIRNLASSKSKNGCVWRAQEAGDIWHTPFVVGGTSWLHLFVLLWMSCTAFQVINCVSVVGLKVLTMKMYHYLEKYTLRRRLSPPRMIHLRRVLRRPLLRACRREVSADVSYVVKTPTDCCVAARKIGV